MTNNDKSKHDDFMTRTDSLPLNKRNSSVAFNEDYLRKVYADQENEHRTMLD